MVAVPPVETVSRGRLMGPDSVADRLVFEGGVACPVLPLSALASEELDESPLGTARAIPGAVRTAVPMPNATASAPTRPTYRA